MRLILPIRLAQTETTRVLGSVFFFRLIPKFCAVANVIFFSFCYSFLDSRDGLRLKEWGGGWGRGCSKSSEERAWSVGKNENNFVGCDRERVKSKGRRKNMKHAKVTTNLKKK